MQVIAGVVLGATYGVIRYYSLGNWGEAISAGILLAAFYVFVTLRVQARTLSDWRKLFSAKLNPWLNLLLTATVVLVGMVRFDATFASAVLDGIFVFAFFSAFAAIFMKTKKSI